MLNVNHFIILASCHLVIFARFASASPFPNFPAPPSTDRAGPVSLVDGVVADGGRELQDDTRMKRLRRLPRMMHDTQEAGTAVIRGTDLTPSLSISLEKRSPFPPPGRGAGGGGGGFRLTGGGAGGGGGVGTGRFTTTVGGQPPNGPPRDNFAKFTALGGNPPRGQPPNGPPRDNFAKFTALGGNPPRGQPRNNFGRLATTVGGNPPRGQPGDPLARFSALPGQPPRGQPGDGRGRFTTTSFGGRQPGGRQPGAGQLTPKQASTDLRNQVTSVSASLNAIPGQSGPQVVRTVDKILAIEKAEDAARAAILRNNPGDPGVASAIQTVNANGPKLIAGLQQLRNVAASGGDAGAIQAQLAEVNRLRQPLLGANDALIQAGQR